MGGSTDFPVLINERFSLIRHIASGTTSHVVEVVDRGTGACLALKILRDPKAEWALKSEFFRLSTLDHPSLVRVHEIGRLNHRVVLDLQEGSLVVPSGMLFLLMDLVTGDPVAGWFAGRGEGERDEALRAIGEAVAGALEQMHARGLVHHDVKPDNVVMTTAGRAVLVDLGLALARSEASFSARGTLVYAAPEALAGRGDHRSDLYGLGATLFELANGGPPFDERGSDLVAAILRRTPRLVAPAGIRPTTARLIEELMQKDPAKRLSSARGLRARFAQMRGDYAAVVELSTRPPVAAPAFCGRRQALTALLGLLAAPRCRLVGVIGAAGCGKSRLIREVQLWQQGGDCPGGGLTEVLGGSRFREASRGKSGLDLDDLARAQIEEWEQADRGGWLVIERAGDDELASRIGEMLLVDSGSPLRVLLELDPGQALAQKLMARAARSPGVGGAGAAAIQQLDLGPLELSETVQLVASMLGDAYSQAALESVWAASRGNTALAVEAARSWAQGVASPVAASPDGLLAELLRRQARVLGPTERKVLFALGVWGDAILPETLARLLAMPLSALWDVVYELIRWGSVVVVAGQIALASRAHYGVWHGLAGKAAAALHLCALDLVEDPLRRAEHFVAGKSAPGGSKAAIGEPAIAAELGAVLGAVEVLAQGHQIARARRLANDGLTLAQACRSELEPRFRLCLGRLMIADSDYRGALATLPDNSGAALVRAEALQRLGDYEHALELLDGDPQGDGAKDEALERSALRGRLLLRLGRYREVLRGDESRATELSRAAGTTGADAVAGLLEVVGLARYYLGDHAGAAELFAWKAEAHGAGPRVVARFCSMRGMVCFTKGEIAAAAQHYLCAVDHARVAGDAHGLATYLGNLGSARLELGAYALALADLTTAVRELARLGRGVEQANALCNLGGLMVLLRDGARAAALADEAASVCGNVAPVAALGYVELLRGDVARISGRFDDAVGMYGSALGHFASSGLKREAALTRCGLSDALIAARRLSEANAAYDALGELGDIGASAARDLSFARLLLSGRACGPGERADLIERLTLRSAFLAHQQAASELWRTAALLGRLLHQAGRRSAALAVYRKARGELEKVMEQSPDAYRQQLNDDPEAQELIVGWRALISNERDESADSDVSGEAPSWRYEARRLRRLLAINQRLNSDLRLPRVLENIVDAVIELTDAERGFLILIDEGEACDAGATFTIKVARHMDRRSMTEGELTLSRSIAEQAAQTGRPVVAYDAGGDERFALAVSVGNLHLRSVLAVPLRVKGAVIGTIYVDHRLRAGAFGQDEQALAEDFAQQAGIAIENARLLAENAERQAQIEELNARLQHQLDQQAVELHEVKEQLRCSEEVLGIRHDYGAIIGRSPRMLELFRLLDRVTDTDLSVVIQGESGTGKELVARAIHDNGLRAGRPFVSENCGAIPETLLESVLFGAARGAYTGSNRDRRGLFEVANGGTLFLDEVGEMSPGMQTKLLRVLQNGEFRRVGSEALLRADVRVLAASNRDLEQLVTAGSFREDLFYRLNVVRIEVPALRERVEDIPRLIERFLQQSAPKSAPSLTKRALEALTAYRWPGNVRELENEVMRLVAMAGDPIDLEDLSPTVRRASAGVRAGASLPMDALSLRPRVEALERELIAGALRRFRGNQSRAAEALGVSRFGLQKKLKRYGLDPSDFASAEDH